MFAVVRPQRWRSAKATPATPQPRRRRRHPMKATPATPALAHCRAPSKSIPGQTQRSGIEAATRRDQGKQGIAGRSQGSQPNVKRRPSRAVPSQERRPRRDEGHQGADEGYWNPRDPSYYRHSSTGPTETPKTPAPRRSVTRRVSSGRAGSDSSLFFSASVLAAGRYTVLSVPN